MGTRQALSTAIRDKLLTLTDYFDEQSVWEHPNFSSQPPAALILPSGVDPEYSTNISNKRLYSFAIILMDKIDGDANLNVTYARMRAIEDAVMDVLDIDPTFQIVGLTLPSGYAIIDSQAAPSTWERVQDDDLGQMLLAEVNIRVYIDRDIE